MRRWLLFFSALLLLEALPSVFRPSSALFPRGIGIAIAVTIVLGWLLCIAILFRHEKFGRREQLAGWLFVAAGICLFGPRFVFNYFTLGHWPPWWYYVVVWPSISIGLTLLFAFIASRFMPSTFYWRRESFSVETEAPDHVTTAEG